MRASARLIARAEWNRLPGSRTLEARFNPPYFAGFFLTGSNIVYQWTLGDGTTASGPLINHLYPTVGLYTATVTARTDVSLIRVNKATLDRADETTQLRFLKVFVGVIIDRLKQTTGMLSEHARDQAG